MARMIGELVLVVMIGFAASCYVIWDRGIDYRAQRRSKTNGAALYVTKSELGYAAVRIGEFICLLVVMYGAVHPHRSDALRLIRWGLRAVIHLLALGALYAAIAGRHLRDIVGRRREEDT